MTHYAVALCRMTGTDHDSPRECIVHAIELWTEMNMANGLTEVASYVVATLSPLAFRRQDTTSKVFVVAQLSETELIEMKLSLLHPESVVAVPWSDLVEWDLSDDDLP